MEILEQKITTILKGIYWGWQVESGIRWESQGACNNREADGRGTEQLEQSSPSACPEFCCTPSGFSPLPLACLPSVQYMTWGGMACVLSWHFILAKNPHREALMPAESSGTLLVTSWVTVCTSKITLQLV